MLFRSSAPRKVICCGLARHVGESEGDLRSCEVRRKRSRERRGRTHHVVASFFGGPKVDLASFVNHEDLIELVVDAFSSLREENQLRGSTSTRRTNLVERNEGSDIVDVGENPQTLGVVERSTGVESASRVVPGADARTSSHLSSQSALTPFLEREKRTISAIETRLRSPPETPRTYADPT